MSVSTPSHFLPEVPASLWSRTGRPRWATIIRLYVALSLIWIGLFFDGGGIARWGWIAAGVGAFLLFPALTRLLLRPLEREVRSASRRTASHRLGLLRSRRLVRTFAPHGWRSSQEATLHLIAGDGQAAAQAFAETGRLARLREPSAILLSGQVHAWILAKDLAKARELSDAREKLGDLGPWDRLHRATLLLAAGQRDESVLGELKELRETLGEHPWILAGLTLAHERSGELAEALTLSEEAKSAGAANDELGATLLKRADKGLRAYKKSQQRQERKRTKADEPSTGSEATRGPAKGEAEDPRSPRGSKKARKQARREARRRAKAEERHRRNEEAARRQRELKTRARAAKNAPEPSQASAATPQASAAALQGAGAERRSADQTSAAAQESASAQESAATAQVRSSAPLSAAPQVNTAGVSAPVIAATATEPRPTASPPTLEPAAAPTPGSASSARGGVVLPPLVRAGERSAVSRSKPPPPPARARGPRTSVPTPRPPRLNLPRLVGSPPAAGLPTRSPKPPSATAPRVLAPPPVATVPQEESGDWGDLDTLFQE